MIGRRYERLALLALAAPWFLASTLASPLAARGIACNDGYQQAGGSAISTPYCQDQLLAEVARGYGMKVSAAKVRDNPNFKREVCRFVGHDIRVQQNCANEAPSVHVPAR